MGQDYGQIDEWNENASWNGSVKYPLHKNMQTYVRELNKLYQAHPALYEQDLIQRALSGSTAATMRKA